MVWNVQITLVLLPICILIFWYLIFLWRRKKLYIYSWNVPGPLSLPIIGMSYKFLGNFDDVNETILEMLKQYTPISKYWFGPYLVYALQDPHHVEKVLTNSKCHTKAYFYKFLERHIGTGLLTAPVPKWKKHRKLIIPSFSQKILDQFVEVFSEQAMIFTDVLKKYSGLKEIDISETVNAMMLDIICETAMGLKMNTQGGDCKFANNFDRAMKIISMQIFKVWYQFDWIWRLCPISRELDKCMETVHEVTLTVIKKKIEVLDKEKENLKDSLMAQDEEGLGKSRMAFLDLILQTSSFTEEELRDEVELFLLAGMDTTAFTVCFCLEMLGLHPKIQQKVYEEVIDIVGESRPIEACDLPNFKYLERVVKETLRIFPVGVNFLREVGEDIDLGNHIIPEGAAVVFSALNIHRNAKLWPEPLKYDPDRFLPEETTKRPPCSYIPFSYGARNCIGNKYAMMSLKTTLATTIRQYRVFTRYQSVEDIKIKSSILLRPKYGFKVYIDER